MAEQITVAVFDETDTEWVVESIISHSHTGRDTLFEVKWSSGDITWLPYFQIEHLPIIDTYLKLQGVITIDELPPGKGSTTRDNMQAMLA